MTPRDAPSGSNLRFDVSDTPLGPLWMLLAETGALEVLAFDTPAAVRSRHARRDENACRTIRAALTAYFDGSLREFDVEIAPRGTAFQQRVWREVRQIPYGETRSYQAIAHAIGQHTSARAVGAANAANPIPLIIPCHRVIGADGSLTGYAGGLERKRLLLALEGAILL